MEKTVVDTQPGAHLKQIFKTKHFGVFIGVVPDLHETPKLMMTRYIIVNIEDGVVLGLTGSRGQAIIAAISAEKELQAAEHAAEEDDARNNAPGLDGPFPEFGGPIS